MSTLSFSELGQVLNEYCPNVLHDLTSNGELTIRDYARQIYCRPTPLTATFVEPSRRAIARALLRFLKLPTNRRFSDDEIERIIQSLDTQAVLLTGPHLHLLLETEQFNALMIAALGAKEVGHNYIFWHANTTSRLHVGQRTGPGWLSLDGSQINLFGLSVREMERTTVYSSDRLNQFSISKNTYNTSPKISEIFARLDSISPANINDLLLYANYYIWENHSDGQHPSIVILDDRFNILLLQELFSQNSDIFNHLFFDDDALSTQISLFSTERQRDVSGMLPLGTDFFWYRQRDRLYPIYIDVGAREARVVRTSEAAAVRWTRDGLLEALEAGQLVPNVYTMMVATSFLPGYRVNGGSRQIMYMNRLLGIATTAVQRLGISDNPWEGITLHGLGSDIYPEHMNGHMRLFEEKCGSAVSHLLTHLLQNQHSLHNETNEFEYLRRTYRRLKPER